MERLVIIKEKLTTLLKLVPTIEGYKCHLKDLEEHNKSLRESLENTHTEKKDMNTKIDSLTTNAETSLIEQEHLRRKHDELNHLHIKLESHSRRDNIKFFGIEEKSHESYNDTEKELKNFFEPR